MGIPDRLWGVLNERGYGSIEEMARAESLRLNESIPAGTLYSYMTSKAQHRRRPLSPRGLKIVHLITGAPYQDLVADLMEEAHETSAAS